MREMKMFPGQYLLILEHRCQLFKLNFWEIGISSGGYPEVDQGVQLNPLNHGNTPLIGL